MRRTEDEDRRQRRADEEQADARAEQRRPQTFHPRFRNDRHCADDFPVDDNRRGVKRLPLPASRDGAHRLLVEFPQGRVDEPVGRFLAAGRQHLSRRQHREHRLRRTGIPFVQVLLEIALWLGGHGVREDRARRLREILSSDIGSIQQREEDGPLDREDTPDAQDEAEPDPPVEAPIQGLSHRRTCSRLPTR